MVKKAAATTKHQSPKKDTTVTETSKNIAKVRSGAKQSAPPGKKKTAQTKKLEQAASVLQDLSPLQNFKEQCASIEMVAGQPDRQIIARDFCAALNEDFKQCVCFSGEGPEARLCGVKYFISEKLFNQLPDAEKRLWCSVDVPIKCGFKALPGLPDDQEH